MKKAIAAGFALALVSMLSDTENAEAAWRYAVETERYTEEYRAGGAPRLSERSPL